MRVKQLNVLKSERRQEGGEKNETESLKDMDINKKLQWTIVYLQNQKKMKWTRLKYNMHYVSKRQSPSKTT